MWLACFTVGRVMWECVPREYWCADYSGAGRFLPMVQCDRVLDMDFRLCSKYSPDLYLVYVALSVGCHRHVRCARSGGSVKPMLDSVQSNERIRVGAVSETLRLLDA